jgi:serine/threonine protein kinase
MGALEALELYLSALAAGGEADLEQIAGRLPAGEPRERFRREALAEEYLFRTGRGEAVGIEPFLARLTRPEDRAEVLATVRAHRLAERNLPAPLRPGTRLLERFVVRRLLGRGGMSEVYAAWDEQFEVEVALKLFNPEARAGSPAEWESIAAAEAKVLRQLESPNLVVAHEVLRAGARTGVVMDLVHGVDLADSLAALAREERAGARPGERPRRLGALLQAARPQGGQPGAAEHPARIDEASWPRTVARILGAIARTVDQAHRVGIVHRDLKPKNVLLRPGGDPVVFDFGLAARVQEGTGQVRSLRGTPEYFAPEQARDFNSGSDVRTDVYQLGLLLYEMLTLTRAQPRAETEPLLVFLGRLGAGAAHGGCVLPNEHPRSLRAICARALAARPEQRYASASELADDLERFARGLPNAHARTPAAHAGWMRARWAVRQPALVAIALGAAALGGGAWLRAEAAGRWSPPALTPFHFASGMSTPQPHAGGEGVEVVDGLAILGVSVEAAQDAWVYALAITGDPQGRRWVEPLRPRPLGATAAPDAWGARVGAGQPLDLECYGTRGDDPEQGLLVVATSARSRELERELEALERRVHESTGFPVAYQDAVRALEGVTGSTRGVVQPGDIPSDELAKVLGGLEARRGLDQGLASDGQLKWLQWIAPVRRRE